MITIHYYKDGITTTDTVNPNGMFAENALKYINFVGLNDPNYKFYLNKKLISLEDGKSFNENHFYNNATIEVTAGQPTIENNPTQFVQPQFNPNFANAGNSQINLHFMLSGRRILIQAQPNTKWCEIIEKFKNKAVLKPTDIPKFIFNSMQIVPDETKTVKDLNLRDQSKIEVFIESEVVGA